MSRVNARLSLAATLYADGLTPAAEIEEGAARLGVSRHALRKAATSLGVEIGDDVWRLPDVVIPFAPLFGSVGRIPGEEAA